MFGKKQSVGRRPFDLPQNIASVRNDVLILASLFPRRTDYEGGAIRGSLNIPAQGFWWNRGQIPADEGVFKPANKFKLMC